MSVSRARSLGTPYRGNEIRLLDAEGNLVRTLTIDEFKAERPVSAKTEYTKRVHHRKPTKADIWKPKYRDFAAEDKEATEKPLETKFDDIIDDFRETRRFDRARGEGA